MFIQILCCTLLKNDKIEEKSLKLDSEQIRRCKLILYKHTVYTTVK